MTHCWLAEMNESGWTGATDNEIFLDRIASFLKHLLAFKNWGTRRHHLQRDLLVQLLFQNALRGNIFSRAAKGDCRNMHSVEFHDAQPNRVVIFNRSPNTTCIVRHQRCRRNRIQCLDIQDSNSILLGRILGHTIHRKLERTQGRNIRKCCVICNVEQHRLVGHLPLFFDKLHIN
jgi:hypothetical protein